MLIRRVVHTALSAVTVVALMMSGAGAARGTQATDARASDFETREEHCHDLYYPALTCFGREEERDLAVASALAGQTLLGTGGYVVAYTHISYGGSSVTLTQDYGNLGFIGWSDTISSYRVYTSWTGYFHENTWYSGRAQAYCCFTHVPYVGDALNDTFSSFNLP